jgi:hypothetical protein
VFQLKDVFRIIKWLGDAKAHWVDAGEHG